MTALAWHHRNVRRDAFRIGVGGAVAVVVGVLVACNSVLGIPEVERQTLLPEGGSASPTCGVGQKACNGACVATDAPQTGCAGESCDPCSTAHSVPGCANGACSVAQCADRWSDCNGNPDDGCEASLDDPATCGDCMTKCEQAFACVDQACRCTVDSCTGGGTCNDAGQCECTGTVCDPNVRCNAAGDCAP